MPYKGADDRNIPRHIRILPEGLRKLWVNVFNRVFEERGEATAFIVANSIVKKRLSKTEFVKRSIVKLELVKEDGQFIKRSDDGEEYITFKLATTSLHKDGKQNSEKFLKRTADEINSGKLFVGDIDHEFYDKIVNSTLSNDTIKNMLKNKKGIAKAIKAVYEKGKLWVKAFIDKRYKRLIEKSKGVSIEAIVNEDEDGKMDGEMLGFTFNINTNPAEYGVGVTA